MASRKIAELRFAKGPEDGAHNLPVRQTPHYQYARWFFFGETGRKSYADWQDGRKKDWFAKCKKFDKIMLSMRVDGLKKPIEVRGNEIVDGHHRAAAWAALGHEEIPCREH